MQIITATATNDSEGPLTRIVNAYCAVHARIVQAGVSSVDDWAPLAQYMATGRFKRVGAYLEEFNWPEYLQFLTDWAGGTEFEMTVFRITEAGNVVIQEIEERHRHGDQFIRKNVVAIYAFDGDNKIRHLDIYEQARESGEWIKEAARDAMTISS